MPKNQTQIFRANKKKNKYFIFHRKSEQQSFHHTEAKLRFASHAIQLKQSISSWQIENETETTN